MNRQVIIKKLTLLIFVLFFVSGGGEAGANGVEPNDSFSKGMVPHKALYDIKMIERHGGADVINISGQMFFEWMHACDAWTTDHRFNLTYEYADSAPLKVTSDFSTYEPYSGEAFDFVSRRKRNGELYEELRGAGEIEARKSGKASYSVPKGLVYELPAGAIFPMRHTYELIKRIKKGERFYNAVIFDGSDDDGPVEVNAFIGDRVNAFVDIEPTGDIETKLVNTPARKIRMAFFPLSSSEEGADYEMTIILHENGVISDMTVEYDDFSVSQSLVAIEAVKKDNCSDGNNAKKKKKK